jgi:hypothetical protein
MIRTLGDLALLGEFGNSGILCGHLVVYNADHVLMQNFVRRVKDAIAQRSIVRWPFMLTQNEVEHMEDQEKETAMEVGGLTNTYACILPVLKDLSMPSACLSRYVPGASLCDPF